MTRCRVCARRVWPWQRSGLAVGIGRFHTTCWEGARQRAWMAHPKRRDDLSIVRDAFIGFVVIVVLVASVTTGF